MRKIKVNAKEITPEKLAELRRNAAGILADHRRSLLNDFPFTGSVLMSLNIIPTRDIRLATAACDGKNIYFDIDFLSSLSAEHAKFVLGHELWHALLAHMIRGEGYDDQERMNIAMDLEVNQLLVKEGLVCPPDGCMPKMFNLPEDLSAEKYYKLLENFSKSRLQTLANNGTGNGTGNGNGDGSGIPSDDPNTSGNSSGKLKGQFDKHLSEKDNVAQLKPDDSINVCDKWGKLGIDPNYNPGLSKSQLKENAERMREAAISAAQTYERSRGTLPGHLAGFVEKITKAEISWQEVLSSFVTRCIGSEPDWNRPNRRFAYSKTYLPSHTSESVHLGVILDTSGSTENDIPKFLGEVNGIVESFSGYSLTVLQVDTRIHEAVTYGEDNPLDLLHTKFQVKGLGGTRLYPGFKWFQENDENEVDAIICFTDGECENFTEDMNPGIPVLWVLTKDGNANAKAFGEICRFKNDSNEEI